VQRSQHVHEVAPLGRRQFLAEAAGGSGLVRKHGHRVRLAEADGSGPVPCHDRSQHERKPCLLPQRDGCLHRRCQALGHRIAGIAEPALLIEVVDGREPSPARGIADYPVVAAAADRGVADGRTVDVPAGGQGVAEVALADSRWPVSHESPG